MLSVTLPGGAEWIADPRQVFDELNRQDPQRWREGQPPFLNNFKATPLMSLRWNQRGVAYWTDGAQERLYWGTGDGYLLSVDAKSGRPVDEFGDRGRIDLMDGLPRAVRGERDYLNALTYSVQSPPLVVGDLGRQRR